MNDNQLQMDANVEKSGSDVQEQDHLRALQEGTPDTSAVVQKSMPQKFFSWPTSMPGPRVKPPQPGTRSINEVRKEQMAEIGYNQVTGDPSVADTRRYHPDDALKGRTSFDQTATAQEVAHRGKKRIDERL